MQVLQHDVHQGVNKCSHSLAERLSSPSNSTVPSMHGGSLVNGQGQQLTMYWRWRAANHLGSL